MSGTRQDAERLVHLAVVGDIAVDLPELVEALVRHPDLGRQLAQIRCIQQRLDEEAEFERDLDAARAEATAADRTRVAAALRAGRPRRGGGRTSVLLAAALLAVGLGLWLVLRGPGADDRPDGRLDAGGGVRAERSASGTVLHIDAELPPGERYAVTLVVAPGDRRLAATTRAATFELPDEWLRAIEASTEARVLVEVSGLGVVGSVRLR